MTKEITLFYSSAHPFSNWYMCPFVHLGHEYNCSEQFMMYKKAMLFGDHDVAEMIMQQGHPRKQKFLGREVRGFDADTWNRECKPIMVPGLVSKFTQDEYCLTTLLDTGDTIIAEASPSDKIWGIGLSGDDPKALNPKLWQGTNWLGDVLMETRDEIRSGKY
jgi:ribA/ribD-fused uncharacterized protein